MTNTFVRESAAAGRPESTVDVAANAEEEGGTLMLRHTKAYSPGWL